MSTELHHLGVADLARQLDAKAVSSVEITKHLLARVAAHQQLGAFLCTDEALALAQAQAADDRRAKGETGPLLGVPLAHKDIFVTTDFPSTAASKMLEGYRSPFDATVVAQLKAAGSVTLVQGGAGNDTFVLGDAVNSLDNILGSVCVEGDSHLTGTGGNSAQVVCGPLSAATNARFLALLERIIRSRLKPASALPPRQAAALLNDAAAGLLQEAASEAALRKRLRHLAQVFAAGLASAERIPD